MPLQSLHFNTQWHDFVKCVDWVCQILGMLNFFPWNLNFIHRIWIRIKIFLSLPPAVSAVNEATMSVGGSWPTQWSVNASHRPLSCGHLQAAAAIFPLATTRLALPRCSWILPDFSDTWNRMWEHKHKWHCMGDCIPGQESVQWITPTAEMCAVYM